ncbi:hypothetical protein RhiirB3_434802 [Rhizophagus irregularis]|nr:hypothetical protein RhiirB3_434802 [Rhizophagus irregularis]
MENEKIEVFNHLNVLESIHIVYCIIDSKFIQQINNIKPFKLKTLFLDERDELLEPLIQKSCNYLEILELVFNLIENIKQNLNYLTINVPANFNNNYDRSSITMLQNLGQFLPVRLEYLNLILRINTYDLEIFLKNFQDNFIKKLLIKNIKKEEYEELFLLEDKVKEFELYDIKVLYYDDLVIDICDFIKETY